MEFATAAAGALLSASFEKLFDVLTSPDVRQLVTKTEFQSQLEYWELMLPKIYAVLEDAHDNNTTTRLEKIWLDNLRHLVYDADDVLDEFATEALRLKHGASTSRSKVTKFLPSLFTTESKFMAGMGSKLKEITARLQTISSHMSDLNLGVHSLGGGRVRSENTARPQTTSLPETHFFGRDSDKKALLNMLLADGADADTVSVIPIQGMGGLGKTTLAQQLYNHDDVKLRFHLRAWVCVSDTFDILAITKTILQSVGGGTCEGKNLDQLQVDLEKTLAEMLQPPRNLETLEIESYCGLEFPTWLGDPSLMSNVIKIELNNCWKSTSLPSLGRLPMLKNLIIKGMKEVKTLGYEFFGNDSGGFQSLETFKLEDMQGLEKWCMCGTITATRKCGCTARHSDETTSDFRAT